MIDGFPNMYHQYHIYCELCPRPSSSSSSQQLQQLQQDVREELAEICQEHEMDSTTKGTWVEFCSGDNCALVATCGNRVGLGHWFIWFYVISYVTWIYVVLYDFIWVYMIQ